MHMLHTKSLALKCQKSDHIYLHETAHKTTLFQLFKSITAGVAEMSTPACQKSVFRELCFTIGHSKMFSHKLKRTKVKNSTCVPVLSCFAGIVMSL